MTERKVIAVVPALNEEDTIERVLCGLREKVDEVIVVDDGSTDGTADIAKRAGAVVLSHPRNTGYDKSLDDGFSLAAQRGATIILSFDADGQHDPANIEAITAPIISGEADVVVGRRPYRARITEHLYALVARSRVGISDPLCGLKAYDIKVYRDVGFFDRIGSIGTHLMFEAKKRGFRIVERDINLEKRADTPRFGRRVKANWKIFKAIVKVLMNYSRGQKYTGGKIFSVFFPPE